MGIFLLVVTVVLELAGAAWSYWYGSHVSAGLAGLLNDALGMFPGLQRHHIHVTGVFMGWAWVALYSLIHLAAVYGHVKSTAKKRLRMGRPGQREITVVDQVYQGLATASPASGLGPVSRLAWPRSFDYLPGYDLTLFFLGSRLIIGEGLFTHHSLKPLLAQQLFAYNSGDVWLRVVLDCLPPGELFVAPLGAVLGLPVGIGPVLTVLCWKKHWRDRVYAGDLFAARLGQRFELIQALDQVIRPREQRKNVLLSALTGLCAWPLQVMPEPPPRRLRRPLSGALLRLQAHLPLGRLPLVERPHRRVPLSRVSKRLLRARLSPGTPLPRQASRARRTCVPRRVPSPGGLLPRHRQARLSLRTNLKKEGRSGMLCNLNL
jgi:hypothetical protein